MKKIIRASLVLSLTFSLASAQRNITTICGNGTGAYNGDNMQATAAEINNPQFIISDATGNLYFSDESNHRVREINTSGVITTVAGNGTSGFSGDGSPATAAELSLTAGLAIDGSGNIYIGDRSNNRVRVVSTTGIIVTIAGTGTAGFTGDGGIATAATMRSPNGVAVDANGNVYFADTFNYVIRKITKSTGIITTIAGIGGQLGSSGDGGPAVSAELNGPFGVKMDISGNIYIADQGNNKIRMVNTSGNISTVAGTGSASYGGDNGPATAAMLNGPSELSIGASGDLLIADTYNQVVRKVNVNYGNMIYTVAGNNVLGAGFSGDGGAAIAAELHFPASVASDAHGDIFIADWGNNRIRKVTNIDVAGMGQIAETNTLTVYPNPASDNLNINFGSVKSNVVLSLYNIVGQEVYTHVEKNASTSVIPVANLNTGIYILRVQNEDGEVITRKVEISR
jgi:hypothetical protein